MMSPSGRVPAPSVDASSRPAVAAAPSLSQVPLSAPPSRDRRCLVQPFLPSPDLSLATSPAFISGTFYFSLEQHTLLRTDVLF